MRKISVKLGFLEPTLILVELTQKMGIKEKGFRVRLRNYSLASIDSAATTRKAVPVQNRFPLVKKYTTTATIIAGISTKNILMRIMIIKPMITKMISAVRSKAKLPSVNRRIVISNELPTKIPQ